ncbi:MAG: hypothetical protein HY243_19090 [Proteobacteria bacterium]|nr:hypothetical protein [Pseudomonadota bacterium]
MSDTLTAPQSARESSRIVDWIFWGAIIVFVALTVLTATRVGELAWTLQSTKHEVMTNAKLLGVQKNELAQFDETRARITTDTNALEAHRIQLQTQIGALEQKLEQLQTPQQIPSPQPQAIPDDIKLRLAKDEMDLRQENARNTRLCNFVVEFSKRQSQELHGHLWPELADLTQGENAACR